MKSWPASPGASSPRLPIMIPCQSLSIPDEHRFGAYVPRFDVRHAKSGPSADPWQRFRPIVLWQRLCQFAPATGMTE